LGTLDSIALVALVMMCGLILLVLFEPGLSYHVVSPDLPLDSADFIAICGTVADTEIRCLESFEVLGEGRRFYAAELADIAKARSSVHVLAFIFHRSPAGDQFVAALAERASKGVKVRVIVDAVGSFLTRDAYFSPIREAGGEVAWYQPLRWYTFKRLNNRVHRELIVIDGEVGYIGGAGIGSHWLGGDGHGKAAWRDTMVRCTGSIVAGMQTAFIANWLESTAEILADREIFPAARIGDAGGTALIVSSAPSPARGSRARVLFQLLLASARQSITINSPYFLPDRSARRELIKAAQRGVRISVVTPGEANNHPIARRASRRRYGELLEAGIAIHEYQPGMIHAKIMVVDELWSVVGSTNFDSRSFDLNDEVNLAAMDAALAARLLQDFAADVAASRVITYDDWLRRPWHERLLALLGVFLERQE